ncbi:hypothetical protein C8R42DRAFT_645681 [Lentinula raphanica]|nr:hypothetical protein C8R42DRAFT_645681 [Lentinula raphanica]
MTALSFRSGHLEVVEMCHDKNLRLPMTMRTRSPKTESPSSTPLPGSKEPSFNGPSNPSDQSDSRFHRDHLLTFKKFILININLPRILLNAVKMLWKFSMLFRSQSYTSAVGFVVPSVALYAFVQRYMPRNLKENLLITEILQRTGILQAAVDITVLGGCYICSFVVWSIIAFIGELGAIAFLAFITASGKSILSLEHLKIPPKF